MYVTHRDQNKNLTEIPEDYDKEAGPPTLLDLQKNLITSIPKNALKNYKHSLRILNLQSNKLNSIECSALNQVINLEWLNLSDNNLQFSSFKEKLSLPQLRHLDLSHNQIEYLPSVEACLKLEQFYSNHNNLSSLKNLAFKLPKTNLQVIHVCNNNFKDLTEIRYLTTFEQLENLDLRENSLVEKVKHVRCYILNWCLTVTKLNDFLASDDECNKAEWLFTDGNGRKFVPGEHEKLVRYLDGLWSEISGQKPEIEHEVPKLHKKAENRTETWVNEVRDTEYSEITENELNNSETETLLESASEFLNLDDHSFDVPSPKKSFRKKQVSQRTESQLLESQIPVPEKTETPVKQYFTSQHVEEKDEHDFYDKFRPLKPMSTEKQMELYGQARPKSENVEKSEIPGVKRPPQIQRKSLPFLKKGGGVNKQLHKSPVKSRHSENHGHFAKPMNSDIFDTSNKTITNEPETLQITVTESIQQDIADLTLTVNKLKTELSAEKQLRNQQTEAIRFLWQIILSTPGISENLSMPGTPFNVSQQGITPIPRPSNNNDNNNAMDRGDMSLSKKVVNFDNVETSTPAKFEEKAVNFQEVEEEKLIAVSLIKKDIFEKNDITDVQSDDTDVESVQEKENARPNEKSEFSNRSSMNSIKSTGTTTVNTEYTESLSDILKRNDSPLPEQVLWSICSETLTFLTTATPSIIVHPNRLFICSRSGNVKIQEFSYGLKLHDQANYLPSTGKNLSIYSLAITLWTAADYGLSKNDSPEFSEEFEKLLVMLSDQGGERSAKEILETSISKHVQISSKSVISNYLIDGVIDRALGRFGLDQTSIDKRQPLSVLNDVTNGRFANNQSNNSSAVPEVTALPQSKNSSFALLE